MEKRDIGIMRINHTFKLDSNFASKIVSIKIWSRKGRHQKHTQLSFPMFL
jgi:hypothetical protein